MAMAIYDLLGAAIALLPPEDRTRAKEYAGYTCEWAPMNANAVKQKASFTVDNTMDFVALAATWYVTDMASPPGEILTPQLMLNAQMSGGRQIFDKDIHIQNFCGRQVANGFPFLFPLWIPRTSTFNLFLSDLANAARTVRITFHGFLLYDRAAGDNRAGGF